jgi:nucleotide-binding universal stress UspA family protein
MIRRILVPLDGSPFGDSAIGYATAIARRAGAMVELVHVHVPHHIDGNLFTVTPYMYEGVLDVDVELDHEILRQELEALRERALLLAEDTDLTVTARLVTGRVDMAVEHEAEAFHADLIVMATHARSGFARARLGSVADAVVRQATMPVLLVRPPENYTEASLCPHLHHVLIAVDGSPFSEQILEPAAELARLCEADVSLMHVEVPHGERTILGMKAGEAALDKMREVSEHYLQYLASTNSELFEQPQLKAVVATYPAAAIVDAARECGAGLVAMATHGRGGLTRLILGSTANEVLIHSAVPVLLYRPRVPAEAGVATELDVAQTRST